MLIKKGDTIKIKTERLPDVTGIVISANNYGSDDDPDWYIEMADTGGTYRYLKQKADYGALGNVTIEFV